MENPGLTPEQGVFPLPSAKIAGTNMETMWLSLVERPVIREVTSSNLVLFLFVLYFQQRRLLNETQS